MEQGYDGFFDLEQLLMEEGLIASTVVRSEAWEATLVRRECADLTEQQKRDIVFTLLGMIDEQGKLPRGSQTKLAQQVGVHKSTICKLFKKIEKQREKGESIDVRSQRFGKCGRKQKYPNNDEWLQSAPLHLRGSYGAYGGALNCSYTHIYRLMKKGMLRAHTSPNHPDVSEENKLQRMKWVLSNIEPATTERKATFVDMKHTVHIDEKWFYLNPGTRRMYLLPKEIDPYRTTKSKNYSIKVMFMGVTSRPLYNEEGEMVHDGKFGIFPFVTKEAAKRWSKNRPAGTVETKVVTKVTKKVIRDMMITKVVPSIREKWPQCMSKDIIIQQDNARPHLSNSDQAFREAATMDGFNMQLVNQPPQSPDFNVLDLGLFRALQSLQYQSFPKDVDELIEKVYEAYLNFDPLLIKYVWVTLQLVMIEALKVKGGNNYKIPHICKGRLQRLGMLSDQVEVDQDIIDEAVAYLNEKGGADGQPQDMQIEDSSIEDSEALFYTVDATMESEQGNQEPGYDVEAEFEYQDMQIDNDNYCDNMDIDAYE